MRRLLAASATAAVLALAGCGGGSENGTARPGPAQNAQPVSEAPPPPLCELLTPDDFSRLAGLTVKAPDTKDVTTSKANCVYGDHIKVDVQVVEDAKKAKDAYETSLKQAPLVVQAQDPIGGVDESAYGTITAGGAQTYGLGVRRAKLVVALELPAGTPDPRPKLLTLIGQLLQRAGALGT